MNKKTSDKGFWRTILIVIAAIFIINAISSGSIFKKIASLFSSETDTSLYVHDEAGVLSGDTVKYIAAKNASLEAQSGARVVIVTLSALNGEDIADKTYALFNEYAPGEKKDNGVLILFAVNDNKYYALQSRGIEDSLSAGTLQLLLNKHAAPAFAEADYDKGIINTFDAVVTHLENMYSVTASSDHDPSYYNETGLFDKLGEIISDITGIAKKLIKTAVVLLFALFGIIAAVVFIALVVKDKKSETVTASSQKKEKENKNPYSHK